MRSGHLVSLVGAAVLFGAVAGCAGVTRRPTHDSGGPVPARGTITSTVGGPTSRRSRSATQQVRRRHARSGEACDDGNKTPGDGCSAICQIPAGLDAARARRASAPWRASAATASSARREACDDGNTTAGDGCSATARRSRPATSAACPAAGASRCAATARSSAARRATTATRRRRRLLRDLPGRAGRDLHRALAQQVQSRRCAATGRSRPSEVCDCGTDSATCRPAARGRTACSSATAPAARRPAPRSRSAATARHDARLRHELRQRQHRDGRGVRRRQPRAGRRLLVDVQDRERASPARGDDARTTPRPARSGNTGECLELPVIYRDFKNESVSGGHPDFFYLGAPIAGGPTITGVNGRPARSRSPSGTACPTRAAPPKKNDSTARCWDIARRDLDANGKPTFNTARNGAAATRSVRLPVHRLEPRHQRRPRPRLRRRRRDGARPQRPPDYVDAAPAATRCTAAPRRSSRARPRFGQWWTDSTYTGETRTRWGRSRWTDRGRRPVPVLEPGRTSVYGGFFPLDPPGQFPLDHAATPAGPGAIADGRHRSEPMLCNLWPYWYSSSASFGPAPAAKATSTCSRPAFRRTTANPDRHDCGVAPAMQGWFHDFWFTDEARYLFTFNGAVQPAVLRRRRHVHLHQRHAGRRPRRRAPAPARQVSIAADGSATIIEGGSRRRRPADINCRARRAGPVHGHDRRTRRQPDGNGHSNCTNTMRLPDRTRPGLEMGKTYEIAVFHADRHPTESNYQLTLSGFATNAVELRSHAAATASSPAARSATAAIDDAVVRPVVRRRRTTTARTAAARPSASTVRTAATAWSTATEECDLGSKMQQRDLRQQSGCTPGCSSRTSAATATSTRPRASSATSGTNNGMPGAPCTKDCKVCVDCQNSVPPRVERPLGRRGGASSGAPVIKGRMRSVPMRFRFWLIFGIGAGRRRRLRASTAARPALAARAPVEARACNSTPIRRRIGSGSTGTARAKAATSATASPAEAAAAIEACLRAAAARPRLAAMPDLVPSSCSRRGRRGPTTTSSCAARTTARPRRA